MKVCVSVRVLPREANISNNRKRQNTLRELPQIILRARILDESEKRGNSRNFFIRALFECEGLRGEEKLFRAVRFGSSRARKIGFQLRVYKNARLPAPGSISFLALRESLRKKTPKSFARIDSILEAYSVVSQLVFSYCCRNIFIRLHIYKRVHTYMGTYIVHSQCFYFIFNGKSNNLRDAKANINIMGNLL